MVRAAYDQQRGTICRVRRGPHRAASGLPGFNPAFPRADAQSRQQEREPQRRKVQEALRGDLSQRHDVQHRGHAGQHQAQAEHDRGVPAEVPHAVDDRRQHRETGERVSVKQRVRDERVVLGVETKRQDELRGVAREDRRGSRGAGQPGA
jgi:hypothetical protein